VNKAKYGVLLSSEMWCRVFW